MGQGDSKGGDPSSTKGNSKLQLPPKLTSALKGSPDTAMTTDGEKKKAADVFSTLRAGVPSLAVKAPPKLSVDDFELLKVIGDGCFGKVMMVRKKDTGEILAMKTIHKDHVIRNKKVKHTRTERNLMTNVHHPFVMNLHGSFQTGGKLYLIMDYLSGGDLFYHLSHEKKFTEEKARFYAAEVMLALECLHKFGYIYRDLKPENILLAADGHICLTDFGLSKENHEEGAMAHTFVGTPEYLAPEVLTQGGYSKEVDWWSLGILIFEMIAGSPPFYSKNRQIVFRMILSAELVIPQFISPDAKDLIKRLLVRNPKNRLGHGPQGSADVRGHAWFSSIDLDALSRKEIVPIFKPAPGDAINFDSRFTAKAACDSPTASPSEASSFTNFTYVKSEWIPPEHVSARKYTDDEDTAEKNRKGTDTGAGADEPEVEDRSRTPTVGEPFQFDLE